MSEYINKYRSDTERAAKYFAKKLAFTLGPVELKKMMAENKVKLIDVRQKEDFDIEHIPGAVSVPKAELIERLPVFSKSTVYVVYCYNQQCHLGASAALTLARNDIPVMELEGGFKVWKEDFGFETE